MTLCWSLAKASIPGEVMDVLEDSLKEGGMPRIATRNVPEGKIHICMCSIWLIINLGCEYCLYLEGKTYSFPTFERAPPEGYLA